MVIRFLAEGAASGLNVIAVYVTEILRVTGFDGGYLDVWLSYRVCVKAFAPCILSAVKVRQNESFKCKWKYADLPLPQAICLPLLFKRDCCFLSDKQVFSSFMSYEYMLKLDFLPPQLHWRCPASLQRVWPPSPSGVCWPSLATGCWPLFSVCWFVWWGGCSGWWEPSWHSGFLDWWWQIRLPLQRPRRFDWAAWCWDASCWLCSLRALRRLVQWSTGWAPWRAGWRQ